MSSSTYKQFLSAPNAALLSPDATLHYITTTTTICGADNIIKHLGQVSKQIKKKAENVIDEINGGGASMLELETVMQFVVNGGPYAPGLDDNFLTDRTVTIPITHIVRYDEDGRIAQIRMKWDQGAMLKELEIISKSGRNWPIRDNRDQLRLLANCLKATGKALSNCNSHVQSYAPKQPQPQHSRGNSEVSLFCSREAGSSDLPAAVSFFARRRQPQPSFNQCTSDDEMSDAGCGGWSISQSPSARAAAVAARRTTRNHHADNQMFTQAHLSGTGSRMAQPTYEEYTTPQRPIDTRGPVRAQDVRHWDAVPGAIPETPVGSKPQPKPRRDAEKHFEIEDDGSTPVHREHYGPDQAHRQKADFQSTYTMTDAAGANTPQGKQPVPADRQKAVDNMGSSWEPADHSPVTKGGIRIAGNGMGSHRNSEPDRADGRGIHIGGDGMGGPKGTKRDWLFGGDEESPQRKPAPRVKPHNQASDLWQF
ncbi:hypothetical protein TD95_002002 [Thielaviopsis punctulata]|uniref:Uncharacterized protein n=1 Tax=Thielaviopsis punctulata TaxID=72032 RepID=A0A0F4ZJV3_9PEZI|nr:hypothetical protein TD95_002002 [Thielaviopsis punctulata]